MTRPLKLYTCILLSLATASSCSDDEKSFSLTPAIGFETTGGTITETEENGIQIGLYTNVSLNEEGAATIEVNNIGGLTYGVDYMTEPAAVNNVITVPLGPEITSPSFYVFPIETGIDRVLAFQITDVTGNNLTLGQQAVLSYTLTINGSGCPGDADPVTVTHDFNGCTTDFSTPAGFIEVFEPGSKTDRGWGCRAFGVNNTRAPRASGFGGAAGDDKAWLIMNPVAIAPGSVVTLEFSVFSNFSGPGTISIKWSSDYLGSGNPLDANWTDLSTINSQFPAAGSQQWKVVQDTFDDICGENVYLAFQFTGANNTASASWDLDNLTFIAQ